MPLKLSRPKVIIIGLIIEPINIPNLNQSLFGVTSTFGADKANTKNKIDTINPQMRTPSELTTGYRAIIKNKIENTMPNDFGWDCSIDVWLINCGIIVNKI